MILDEMYNHALEVRDARQAKKGPKVNKHLKGLHCYDMLAHPVIAPSLSYVSADNKNRNELIIDGDDDESNDNAQSDMVRAVLNLAYLPDHDHFRFDVDYMMSLIPPKDSIQ